MDNENKSNFIKSLSLGGFRSFGSVQRFRSFTKINLLIGQNNSGKSNVLRFIHDLYPLISSMQRIQILPIDRHLPSLPSLKYGTSIKFEENDQKLEAFENHINSVLLNANINDKAELENYILSAFRTKATGDSTEDAWFEYDETNSLIVDGWTKAIGTLGDQVVERLWKSLTHMGAGSREIWISEIVQRIKNYFPTYKIVMIPAVRKIGAKGSISEDFGGEGIIERLAKLQNPNVHNQADKKKFENINAFLQNVTANETARIEIPHDRDTIMVHMNEKTLPLESLGTGIHEVIILAVAATSLENSIICMEEPELHLNPLLQKKLIRFLSAFTSNQYFISTHSAAFMDTPGAETYHISLVKNESVVERVTSDKHRSAICEDLGYHPSDLLQSNCVIWVEGPSDRIYLNFWISHFNKTLIEGIHYSIMFYGGRLASHLSGDDNAELVDDFISLRRLNRRGVIVIDSDKATKNTALNKTKMRLCEEFDRGPGYAWITKGREIENYLDTDQLKDAINNIKPSARINSTFGQFENTLSILTKKGVEEQASKVRVANFIVENYAPDSTSLDLKLQLSKLSKFIEESNPKFNGI